MTDNEKRAHDIAIALLPILYSKTQDQTPVDAYAEYKNAYECALANINRDFPAKE